MENHENQLNAVAQSWELYKSYNDRLVNEITTQGSPDPLTVESINKINSHLDAIQCKAGQIAAHRPQLAPNNLVKESELEYKQAFKNYVKSGVEAQALVTKALSASNEAEGGYLVTSHMAGLINQHEQSNNVIRSLATVETISNHTYEFLEEFDGVESAWVQETQARGEMQNSKLNKRFINVHELYCQPKATQMLLDDASIDIEAWLAQKIAESFASAESKAFISGDGVAKPFGLLHDSPTHKGIATVNSGVSAELSADSLIRLIYALPEKYAANAQLLMNRTVLHKLRSLKCPTTERYLWEPSLQEGTISKFMGINIVECADMPVATNGAKAIVYGDFKKGYRIIDRAGINILRDPFTEKPFIKFYATKRVGADIMDRNALIALKLEA